jgi:hypothetical protein
MTESYARFALGCWSPEAWLLAKRIKLLFCKAAICAGEMAAPGHSRRFGPARARSVYAPIAAVTADICLDPDVATNKTPELAFRGFALRLMRDDQNR